MMLTVCSMAPAHSLGQDEGNEIQHDYSGHVTPLVLALVPLAMTPLHLYAQHNPNEVQHNLSGHVMPLAPALEDNQNQVQHYLLVM